MFVKKMTCWVFFGLWLSATTATAQKRAGPAVNWVRFQQLDSLQRQQPRPVFVFLHTSWCGYCQLFKRGTLRRAEVVQQLNDNFYSVSFNPESTEPIVFQGRTFTFRPTGINTGQHELATYLMQPYKETAYPGLIFLNPTFQPVTGIFSALPYQSFLQLTLRVTDVVK